MPKSLFLSLLVFLFTAAGASGYFFFRPQIIELLNRVIGTKQETVASCLGVNYTNSRQGYKVCYHKGWYNRSFGYSDLWVGFDSFPIPQASEYPGVFSVKVWRESSATRLAEHLQMLKDAKSTAITVGGVTGIKVEGTLSSHDTFFPNYHLVFIDLENASRTYEVELLSAPDGYAANIGLFGDFVGSLTFVPGAVSPPWGKDIYLESPWPGDTLSCKFHIAGSAQRAFENTINVKLKTDRGTVLVEKGIVYNAPDVGQLGTFDEIWSYKTTATSGELDAANLSAKDGSVIDLVSVPVKFASCK